MGAALTIQPEAPDTAEAMALIGELDAHLNALYAPENQHGLSVAALRDPAVIFLIAHWEGIPVGCGAVKFFPGEYGEVKRMYVRPAWRGRGVARSLLRQLERVSREQGYRLLRLETGVHQPEAVRLYESVGFARCGVFGAYVEDGFSLCYEKALAVPDGLTDSSGAGPQTRAGG